MSVDIFKLKPGDKFSLKNRLSDRSYEYRVSDVEVSKKLVWVENSAGLSVAWNNLYIESIMRQYELIIKPKYKFKTIRRPYDRRSSGDKLKNRS